MHTRLLFNIVKHPYEEKKAARRLQVAEQLLPLIQEEEEKEQQVLANIQKIISDNPTLTITFKAEKTTGLNILLPWSILHYCVRFGHLDIAQRLLATGKINPRTNGYALIIALDLNKLDFAKLLIEMGWDINAEYSCPVNSHKYNCHNLINLTTAGLFLLINNGLKLSPTKLLEYRSRFEYPVPYKGRHYNYYPTQIAYHFCFAQAFAETNDEKRALNSYIKILFADKTETAKRLFTSTEVINKKREEALHYIEYISHNAASEKDLRTLAKIAFHIYGTTFRAIKEIVFTDITKGLSEFKEIATSSDSEFYLFTNALIIALLEQTKDEGIKVAATYKNINLDISEDHVKKLKENINFYLLTQNTTPPGMKEKGALELRPLSPRGSTSQSSSSSSSSYKLLTSSSPSSSPSSSSRSPSSSSSYSALAELGTFTPPSKSRTPESKTPLPR